jgi:hypothetical protein
MERTKYWRAVLAAGAMVAVALPVLSADAAVGGRRSIEATTTSDLVILDGYPRGAQVLIKVVRNGNVVGFATKKARGGTIEMNHSGRAAGDCWESPRTPNIRPGDTIRTRILGQGIRDSMVVRGVFIDSVVRGDTSVTVSGHVQLAGRTGVPSGPLELRVRTDSADLRQDVRADVSDTGTFSREIPVAGGEAAGAEVVLEWIGGGAGELTVAEEPGPALALPGCPPVEAN